DPAPDRRHHPRHAALHRLPHRARASARRRAERVALGCQRRVDVARARVAVRGLRLLAEALRAVVVAATAHDREVAAAAAEGIWTGAARAPVRLRLVRAGAGRRIERVVGAVVPVVALVITGPDAARVAAAVPAGLQDADARVRPHDAAVVAHGPRTD